MKGGHKQGKCKKDRFVKMGDGENKTGKQHESRSRMHYFSIYLFFSCVKCTKPFSICPIQQNIVPLTSKARVQVISNTKEGRGSRGLNIMGSMAI